MKFSYNWLKEIAKFKESPEKLAELLTLRVFEVEGVIKNKNDYAIDIKLLPNRLSDASGHIGMAQEIAMLKNIKIKPQIIKLKEAEKKSSDEIKIEIKNKENCLRYTARVMKDVKVGDSPLWLKERLENCGLQSINNIVDAANYIMLETGQPLHVFDLDKIEGKKIIVRNASKEESLTALDDKSYILNQETLVIADIKKPIAIAGIKGGKNSGVSQNTKNIVLESANFDQANIRKTSQSLQLRTDASIRFEHGMDPDQTNIAIDKLAQIIQKLAGGKILKNRVDVVAQKPSKKSILVRRENTEKVIGVSLKNDFYKKAFASLGWDVKNSKNGFIVNPPSIRRDIEIEEDIIEELTRIYSYEKIPSKHPKTSLISPKEFISQSYEDKIKDLLIASGFNEIFAYEFTSEEKLNRFGLSSEGTWELKNPVSPETRFMLPRAVISFILSASENLRHMDNAPLFGIAKSFKDGREQNDIAIVLAQKNGKNEEEFLRLKGAVDSMLENLGISDYWHDDSIAHNIKTSVYPFYHPYRFTEIKIGEEKIGAMGQIHPAILEKIKVRGSLAAAEINFDKLVNLIEQEIEYKPIGKYPASIRDIAVIVSEEIKADEVSETIENAGGELLIDSDLFDYFQDKNLAENGKKSLAFHLIFQSREKTLTDEETSHIIQKIEAKLKEKGWIVK